MFNSILTICPSINYTNEDCECGVAHLPIILQLFRYILERLKTPEEVADERKHVKNSSPQDGDTYPYRQKCTDTIEHTDLNVALSQISRATGLMT